MNDKADQMEPYIPYYIHQFGRIRFKGADFLVRILKHFVMDTSPEGVKDYKQFITETAAEKEVTPDTLRRAVKRYMEDGWKQGFSWEWKNIPAGAKTLHPIPARRLNCSANRSLALLKTMGR